ncbi:MAG TPA: response regulator transcription factor [Bacteroidales bacterium]|nr:response regulator transcription factor [Bacteroidales bacterium]
MPEKEKIKILLVEDDINLGFLLVDFLESNDYEVRLCKDGESGLKGFNQGRFDFCIFDIMLPKIDGFTLVQEIRKTDKSIPIMLLSARSLQADKIKGFNLGIDDYIVKPFDEQELLCRLKAILNRSGRKVKEKRAVKIGKYEFDQPNQVLKIGEKCQKLTLKESNILTLLCDSENSIVKREELMNTVWGECGYYTGRSLDVFISKLRSYLRDDKSVTITTIPTVGYRLERLV